MHYFLYGKQTPDAASHLLNRFAVETAKTVKCGRVLLRIDISHRPQRGADPNTGMNVFVFGEVQQNNQRMTSVPGLDIRRNLLANRFVNGTESALGPSSAQFVAGLKGVGLS
jgi:hypothetical protein